MTATTTSTAAARVRKGFAATLAAAFVAATVMTAGSQEARAGSERDAAIAAGIVGLAIGLGAAAAASQPQAYRPLLGSRVQPGLYRVSSRILSPSGPMSRRAEAARARARGEVFPTGVRSSWVRGKWTTKDFPSRVISHPAASQRRSRAWIVSAVVLMLSPSVRGRSRRRRS